MPPDQPRQPAVIKGTPSAFKWPERQLIVFCLLIGCVGMPALLLWSLLWPASKQAAGHIPSSVLLIVTLTGICIIAVRIHRLRRRIRTTPNPCLHCLYPLEPNAPHCPECGRLNNRQDLNQYWSNLLKRDA